MSRGVKTSVKRSDECRLGTMEALEADNVSRRRMILEKNAPTRPATNTALTVLEPPAPRVTATHTFISILEQWRRWVANSIRQECQRAAISTDGDGRR